VGIGERGAPLPLRIAHLALEAWVSIAFRTYVDHLNFNVPIRPIPEEVLPIGHKSDSFSPNEITLPFLENDKIDARSDTGIIVIARIVGRG